MAERKPKKAKSQKVNLNNKNNWRNILKEVEKHEVPIHVLEKLCVHLKDGTQVMIDIKTLLAAGCEADDIEEQVNEKLQELDMYIDNVDFFVDIDEVQKTVQPETDKILGKL